MCFLCWEELISDDSTNLSFTLTSLFLCVISGFRREVDESCPLLGYAVAFNDNSLLTFRGNPSSRILDLWRWVGKELSLVCVIAQKSVVFKYAFISLPYLVTYLYKRNVTLFKLWCHCDISWFSIQLVEAKGSFSCYLVLKNIPFVNKQDGRIWGFMDIDMWKGHKCYYICYLAPRHWEFVWRK